jgi:hypothetical protein
MVPTAGQKAARTRQRRAAARKAAATRQHRLAGKKAARTRIRRSAGRKAAATRKRRAAGPTKSSSKPGPKTGDVPLWGWRDGSVNRQGGHIELRHGNASKNSYKEWLPVALIGKPQNHIFPVLWLMDSDTADHQRMIDDARRELDYYLVEKREHNPWGYAQHHCNTGANMYSSVHWSYFPKGVRGDRRSSVVISVEEAAAPARERKPQAGP